jgi:hypothetical protein
MSSMGKLINMNKKKKVKTKHKGKTTGHSFGMIAITMEESGA